MTDKESEKTFPTPEDLELFLIHGQLNICHLWSIAPTIYTEDENQKKIINIEIYDGISIINGIPILSKESAYYADENYKYSPIDISEKIYLNKLVNNNNDNSKDIERN